MDLQSMTADQLIVAVQGLITGDHKVLTLNLIALISGVFVHVHKRLSENDISFKQYWKGNLARSLMSVIALFGSFLALSSVATPLYSFFAIGYSVNSIVNKTPTKEEADAEAKVV